MIKFLKEPFGLKPILKKEDIGKQGRENQRRASNMSGTLKRLWKFMRDERFRILLVICIVVITSLLGIVGPFLVGQVIDNYLVPKEFDGFVTVLLILLGVYVLHSVSTLAQSFIMVGASQRTVFNMRYRLFNHMQYLPIDFYNKRQQGELMSRMTNDIETISQTLNTSFIQFTTSVITLIGTVSVMLYLSPLLTVLTLTIIPLLVVLIKYITNRTRPLYRIRQKRTGELNAYIEEVISGQEIVKAFSQEDYVIDQFEKRTRNLRDVTFWANLYSGMIPKIMNMLNNLSFTIVAGIGGILALTTDTVTVGIIVVFAEYARQFTRPLADLANQFNQVLSAIAGAERVFDIIDTEAEKDDGVITNRNLDGHIEFKNVVFRYDKDQKHPTINDVSFDIKPGESIALIGSTGAGKTTIVQLLNRFYEVDAGEILIDGDKIEDYKRDVLKENSAFVLQDPFIFNASIKDNVRFGKLDATDEEIIEACKSANAHDFIMGLEDGYDTVIDGETQALSVGERQLVSIARAFVRDPNILLLDEATSSIDTITELKIQEALENLMKDRTSIIIAHRLNTVRAVDRLIVLEHGEIIEIGSHEELLEQKGVYYNMVNG